MRHTFPKLPRRNGAGFLLKGLLLAAFAFVVSCDKHNTPDWDHPGGGASSETPKETPPPAPLPTPPAPVSQPETPAPVAAKPSDPAPVPSTDGIRFIAYNVKNWLKMDRYVDRQSLKNAPKPDDEKAAVIAILARHTPDVIGLCEIGTAEDLAEVQQMLKAAGTDLPYSHYTGGADPVRHLGFLSRFPIVATGKPEKTDFRIQGKAFAWNRGVLDVTIDAYGRHYHFLGVHFKSKREINDGDQEEMRRSEARLLRRHADAILTKNPDERLIVYGDFNDTRSSVSGKHTVGNYNDPNYLTAIPAQDSVGTRWTHYWALNDVYSRIDFITVSRALKPDTEFREAKILDDPEWEKASDHRAILAIFR